MYIARKGEGAEELMRARRLVCRALLDQHRLVVEALGKRFSISPYWDSLLLLYLAELEGQSFYQSCLATGASPSNAHRQSARLAKLGLVVREADPDDNRRTTVRLSQETRTTLDELMDRIGAIEMLEP